MPELSRFYGISIKMYYSDHNPPHFHAVYGRYTAAFTISPFSVLDGDLPPRAVTLVREWTSLHKTDLLAAWHRALNGELPGKIAPLP